MAPRSEIDRAAIGVTEDCGDGHIRKSARLFRAAAGEGPRTHIVRGPSTLTL